MKLVFRLALLASLVAGLSACDILSPEPAATPLAPVQQSSSGVIVEGRVAPRDAASLFFTASGKVAEILVVEGDQVVAGQTLARLGDRAAFEANLAAAQLELVTAQQQLDDLNETADLAYRQAQLDLLAAERNALDAQEKLDELDTTAYQDDLDAADEAAVDAQKVLDDAQEEFDRYKDLDSDNADRKRAEDELEEAETKNNQAIRDRDRLVNDLAQAQAAVDAAQAVLTDAQLEEEARRSGAHPDDLALAEARLNNAQAQLASAQAALDNLELTAPFDGVVTTIDIAVGEQALPNQAVMLLADFSSWYIDTTDLTENEVVKIKVGQAVTVVPDALPELTLPGEIESISRAYQEKAGDITYEVRIQLSETDERLRWGMTVEVQLTEVEP